PWRRRTSGRRATRGHRRRSTAGARSRRWYRRRWSRWSSVLRRGGGEGGVGLRTGRRQLALAGDAGAMDLEAESIVERDRGRVPGVHVQVRHHHAARGDRVQTGEGELGAEALTVEVGIDGDDVDLADDRI